MATFKYSARDASGRVVAGAIEADTEVMVIGKLQEMGFYVTSMDKEGAEVDRALPDPFGKYPQTFSNLMVNMVRAGEVGGVLDDVLNRVATFFEKDLSLRQKVRAAVTYPAALLIFAIGIIFFLVFFILPQFIGFFEGLDLVLPLPTRVLIAFTKAMTGYWYIFLGLLVLAGYALSMYRRTPAGRMNFDRFTLRIPIFVS